MSQLNFDAVIFDLDGVITQTALVHSQAWKKMFDDYLREREKLHGEPFREFTQKEDYLPYVDGKPRYEGVRSFLMSRGIDIPFGTPEDDPGLETVCGLGNRKNLAFNEVLAREGVKVYESTIRLIHELRDAGIRIGVASSSKNCYAVLEAAGLLPFIETRVDGVVSAQLQLKGKPEPDIFLTACKNLDCLPERSVVVEDATSGVAAGRKGEFGLVLGIAREGNESELYENGADIVVRDLEEITINDIDLWFGEDEGEEGWEISYTDYVPQKERTRETLLTVGNGYLGTRGAMEEKNANSVNYPGTYIAGVYNRLITNVSGKDIENEDFVNCPNWLPVTFRINNGDWFDPDAAEILSIDRTLSFSTGVLTRQLMVRDKDGHETAILSERFVSMRQPHLAGIRYSVTPLNYSGVITFKAGLDGNIINDGVERYKSLNQQHLRPLFQGADGNRQYLAVRTTQSGIIIAEAAAYDCLENEDPLDVDMEVIQALGMVSGLFSINALEGSEYSLVKRVAIYTSKPDDTADPLPASLDAIGKAGSFDELLFESMDAWDELWSDMDMIVEDDMESQKLIRLHLYHLLVSMSPNNSALDASITARGLHGEAYRGHIFWDELFIMPLYDLHLPETARAMLLYRYHRLDKARAYAKQHGYKGAMYPWQSGSDGREETQVIHLNPLSGNWDPDHSSLQRHVSLAIAINVWQYFNITADLEFLKEQGAEMFLEICRFWASKARFNASTGRYSIDKVMGPDEFHEQYPGAAEGGLRDNAYINILAAWAFEKAGEILGIIGVEDALKIREKINLTDAELEEWDKIAGLLTLCINNEGIIAQYDGYFDLKELDWEHYRNKYGNIYRMDRILKSENLSPDAFKVAKQADMLMTFYVLDKPEVDRIISHMGYTLPEDYLQRNLEYYLQRTSHGSTLSRVVHARLALLAGKEELSRELFFEALASDFNDIQGGTTGEGIHAGVMAGTLMIALTAYAGVNFNGDMLRVNPNLPEKWPSLEFGLHFRGVRYSFLVTNTKVTVLADANSELEIFGRKLTLEKFIEQDALPA